MNSKSILLFLLLAFASTTAFSQTATEPSGDGSESTPYQISTLDNLYWITQNSSSWDKFFQQTADIDASSTSGWDGGDGWSPIGNWDVAFSGSYDGGNFSISGLTMARSSSGLGLFGYASETAAIEQVVLVDVSINGGYDFVGTLVGENYGMVFNSHMSGMVDASEDGYYTGGLVGYNEGTVHQSSATGDVFGRYGAGGLVGGNYGTISQSFATGNVIANESGLAGGLVGENGGPITDSYATGRASGDNYGHGGLIGEYYGTDDEIVNTYAVGIVRGPSGNGGLIGYSNNTVLNSYWLSNTGNVDNGTGSPLNGTDMRQAASFTGFDFDTIWEIAEGETYPTLQGNPQTPAPGTFPLKVSPDNQAPAASRTPLFTWIAGNVDSYEIQVSISDDFSSTIVSVSELVATEYQLESPLDAGETYYWRIRGYDGVTPLDWTDIHSFTTSVFTVGDGTSGNPYQISTADEFNSVRFNLSAHYVLTADIDLSEFSNDGAGFEPIGFTSDFMGVLDGAGHKITGLFIHRPDDQNIGLIGRLGATGEVKRVGLLDVRIEGEQRVGGLIGYNNGGSVSENFVTGVIRGFGNVGGLIGSSDEGEILNNYTLSSTSASYNIAGLVGDASNATISHNYVSGSYVATDSGGYPIYGSGFDNTFLNNFWDMNPAENELLGGTRLDAVEMRTQSSFTGFDFTTIWQIDEGRSFPYLRNNVQNPAPGNSPTIESPENGLTGVPVLPEFTWTNIPTFDHYSVQVSTSLNFDEIVISAENVIGLSYQSSTELAYGTQYYWRVVGYLDGVQSNWSLAAGFKTTYFALGSGTSEDPYQISTAELLDKVRFELNAHFILTADIDLSIATGDPSGIFWNSGRGFDPIGNSTTAFTGVFDGNGHIISGMHINRPFGDDVNDIGLFGRTGNTAEIKKVRLLDVDIDANFNLGGLIGENRGTVTENIVTGDITGQGNIGGLIGVSYNATISNNYTQTNTFGNRSTSGLVGMTNNDVISQNYVFGTFDQEQPPSKAIYNNGSTASASNNYWFAGDAVDDDATAVGLTSAQMRQEASFVGFDFEAIWGIVENQSYPYLRNNQESLVPGVITSLTSPENSGTISSASPLLEWLSISVAEAYHLQLSTDDLFETILLDETVTEGASFQFNDDLPRLDTYYWRVRVADSEGNAGEWTDVFSFDISLYEFGDGSPESPYQIATVEQLNGIRNNLSAHYILVGDIDLGFATGDPEGPYWNDGSGWAKIGSSSGAPFTGQFDGNGKTISNLFIDRSSETHNGLFGYANGATIQDVGLVDVDITSGSFSGALVASAVTGTNVLGNYSTGTIHSSSQYIGGLIGTLVGAETEIANNYSSVNVTGGTYVGGLIGVYNTSSIITNNYSIGTVSGTSSLGGFAGRTLTGEAVTGTLNNNYWNSTISGLEIGVGDGLDDGTSGLTSAQMRQQSSFPGFDFIDTWSNLNGNTFPYLQVFTYEALPGFLESELSMTGKSLAFDTGTLTVPHNAVYNDLQEMTIEAWLYPENLTTQGGIIEKHQSPSSGWWVRTSNTGKVQALFVTPGDNPSAATSASLQLNTWQHVVVVYDGTGVQIYIDGQNQELAPSNSGSGTITNNTRHIQIGKLNWVGASHFDGNMDEIRVWNKALTEEDIRRNMFQRLNGDEDGLIAYYPMDEIDGSLVVDQTGINDYSVLDAGTTRSDETHPYGTFITGDEGWRILSSPVGASYADLLAPLWTQGFPGSDSPDNGASNVRVWDEATRQFTSVADAADVPAAGAGFITYVFDDADYDGTPDGFPKRLRVDNTQRSGSVNPTLSYTESGDEDERGWNLVGNPYGSTIDWDAATGLTTSNLDATVYVWNSDVGDYQTWNGLAGTLPNGLLAPWQGFWLKANAADPSIQITDDSRSAGGIMRKENPTPVVRFSVQGEAQRSSTVVMLSDQAETGKDRYDAYKLHSLKSNYVSLFTQMDDGTALDINAIPAELLDIATIPLDMDGSDLNGDFELTWDIQSFPDDWLFKIRDNETGEELDMKTTSSHTFQHGAAKQSASDDSQSLEQLLHEVLTPRVMKANSGTTSRFTLTITPGYLTSVEEILLPKEISLSQNFPNPFNPSTVIGYQLPVDSHVELRVYDMLGREVSTLASGYMSAGRHSVTFNAQNLASGMYIYRLVAGSTVITKKLTLIK